MIWRSLSEGLPSRSALCLEKHGTPNLPASHLQGVVSESTSTIYVSILCDLAITAAKFTAAAFTQSAAMFSEGVHSVVDSLNGVMLLWGKHASRRRADLEHPFGYGKELYFWTLLVALLIFAAGGGASIYEGIASLRQGSLHQEASWWNHLVLGASAVFEAVTVLIAWRDFRRLEGPKALWHGIRASKDPTVFTVLLENIAGLAGVGIAFAGIFLARHFHAPAFDGISSILIGLLLAGIAVVMAIESKGLLIGEGMDRATLSAIRQLVENDPAVVRAGAPLTMYFGPHSILLALEVEFQNGLSAKEITAAVDRLESAIRNHYPTIERIFIEAEALSRAGRQPGREHAQTRAALG
jgi:cation diffusion facilitator family transporter